MRTIWKYDIGLDDIRDDVSIAWPVGGQLLKVGEQNGRLCFWVLVDTQKAGQIEVHDFAVRGTGHNADEITTSYKYWGTILFYGGGLVLHVFEKPRAVPV